MVLGFKCFKNQKLTILQNILLKILGIIFAFFMTGFNIQAQEYVNKKYFTSQNGLNISWVHSLTEGPDQNMLMGHGAIFYLTKYDGYNFQYIYSPSVVLGKIFEDNTGSFWAVKPENLDNINYYSNNEWQDLEFEAGIPFLPIPGFENKLLFLRDGILKEFDKASKQIRIIKRPNESRIGPFNDIIRSRNGGVWITGENGVAQYFAVAKTGEFQDKWLDYPIPKTLGLSNFTKPFEGISGELTVMGRSTRTDKNILTGFNGSTWEKLYIPEAEKIYCGWRGEDQSLWIIKGELAPLDGPLRNWSLFHVDQYQEEIKVEKNKILTNVLNDIVVQDDASFWLATGSGLARFAPSLWRSKTPKKGFKHQFKKIHQDLSGQIWLAGEDAFSLYANEKWESYQFNPPVFTGDVCSLNNGLLVVGISKTKLALFNPDNKSCIVSNQFGDEMVRYYDQKKDGQCFIILESIDGISRLVSYDGENIEELANDLKINELAPGKCEVTDILQTGEGDIWITTFTDIIYYKNGIRNSFEFKEEFNWGISTSILEIGNKDIWISGSNGILQFNGEGWSVVQSPEFETARVMLMAGDSSIWVGSGTGIHRLLNGSWITYSIEEGVPDAVIYDLFEDKDERIWGCSYKGAFCYYSKADSDPPETYVPSDQNFSEAIPSGEMQFIFEGYDKWNYTASDRLLFSYRFDDNPWTPFKGESSVIIEGLSDGSHVFEVRAMDRNGNIDPSPAVWSFTVLLPWYKETYFIILAVISICLIILSLGFAITRHFRVERLVVQRTAELVKTKEKAEESDRLKSAFLANMSHEIRTPMNGILGFASLLKEANLSGESQQEYINIIEKSGTRMLSLINDIISLSKIESGQMEVILEDSDINNQVEYVYDFFKPETDNKGIEFLLTSTLDSEEAIIKTDTEKLYVVLTNLVKNAIKFTEKGLIEFGYKLEGDYLEFFVKDTGVGIPINRQQAIFERFIQADISDKMAKQGAGLGLSISRAYVELLGGKIWVESKEGKGSIFYFTIPYNNIKEKSNNIIKEKKPVKVKHKTSDLKVLIVDDDKASLLLLSIMIKRITSNILIAINGAEAVEICKSTPDIGLVFMDIQMPEMNGFDAIRKIRKFNKDLLIIAQTAFAMEGDKKKLIDAGFNNYISKPINEVNLRKIIKKHLN